MNLGASGLSVRTGIVFWSPTRGSGVAGCYIIHNRGSGLNAGVCYLRVMGGRIGGYWIVEWGHSSMEFTVSGMRGIGVQAFVRCSWMSM